MSTPVSTLPMSVASPRPRRQRTRFLSSQASCGLLFITPALIGFTFFYLLPTIRAFYIGLTNWSLLRAPKWVGLDNYIRLFQDEKFWKSIWVTFLYVLYNIPGEITGRR